MAKKQSTKQPKDKTAKKPDIDDVLKDFNASWEYCAGSWHDRWDNNYRLYNNERVKRGYLGISDTFVPMTFSTIETMTSALFGTKPKFGYMPPQQKQEQKTDILNGLLDFYWEKDQWSTKVINTGRSMLMRGVGIDYWCWENDHPVMINVPLRDFFIDPYATTMENARYMGRRYLITKEELESYEVIDLDAEPDEDGNYPMKKKYTNLDKLDDETETSNQGAGAGVEKTDKQEKDHLYGSTIQGATNQIEVIEWWTEDRVISLANRKVRIEDTENYYKAKARANGVKYPRGIMPFAACRDYVDESLFYAKGEVDFIADMQEDLNDISNQNKDAISFTLNQMYTLDPKYKDSLAEVENLPGAVYPFEAGALQPIPQRPIPPDAFNERMNIKNEIRETTASNEVVKGSSPEGGKATATEINAQIMGAGQRINLKVTQIENEYFHRMARIIFEMIKLYVTEPMMVRIIGKDGARWEEFNPEDFADGDYEPHVQLDISIQGNKQQQAMKSQELLAAFLGDPDVNQQELKKMVLQRSFDLDPDEVQLLMTPMDVEAGAPSAEDPLAALLGAGAPPLPGGMPDEQMMIPEEDMMLEEGDGNIAPDPTDPAAPNPEDFIEDPETGELIPISEIA